MEPSCFISSLIPGVAVALLALDLAATTVLQTELVYEIAAAYGLDLNDPARKGEVLAIFGLALGGGNARTPQPLGVALQQLDCDFAVPLFAQCQQLAQRKTRLNEAISS